MRSLLPLAALLLLAACSINAAPEPSLAPRGAEAIDPRIPIPDTMPTGPVDPAIVGRLEELVRLARAGVPAFEVQEVEAARLASTAGPIASESWIAAQQALSRLVELHGVTAGAAADIDALAAERLDTRRWIVPADQAAIAAAAAEVGAVNQRQVATIDRIRDLLAR